jgi:hypothetical protein
MATEGLLGPCSVHPSTHPPAHLVSPASDGETNYMSEKEACTHYHTSVIELRSPNGYKARCLSCGADGPEWEKAATTFVVLLAQSHQERLRRLTP